MGILCLSVNERCDPVKYATLPQIAQRVQDDGAFYDIGADISVRTYVMKHDFPNCPYDRLNLLN